MTATKFELKKLTRGGVAAALQKAERYRLLNEPEPAESICLDVLELEPNNQRALEMLILALSDQFGNASSQRIRRARELTDLVDDEYRRHYLLGLLHERQARSALRRAVGNQAAYESFREAMEEYERAEALRPEGNDDPILRWNSCARLIERESLSPDTRRVDTAIE